MVTFSELWLAILLSAALVWIGSAIVWMLLPHHRSDYKGLPNEEAARAVLGEQKLTPGQYNIPHLAARDELQQPEGQRKFDEGPVGFLTVLPNGVPPMGKSMGLSFVYYLLIGIFIAYVASRTLSAGAEYLTVFRLTGTAAFLAYGFAVIPDAIWFGRPWSAVAKNLFDALLYALLTAGVFGWLWPH